MLHTVNKSPTDKPSLLSCLRLAQPGSDILLIEDAVYAAVRGTKFTELIEQALASYQIFALAADLECRGFNSSKVIPGVQTIDYQGFVALAVNNEAVHAWL